MASANTPAPTRDERITRCSPEEVASEGNVDLIDEICVEDVLDRGSLGEVRERDELKAQISGLKESFSDFSATVEDAITEGGTVVMHVTLRGTHDDAFMGVEPIGKPIRVSNMVSTRIEDGVIAERWTQPDMLDMLTQPGAVEPPTA